MLLRCNQPTRLHPWVCTLHDTGCSALELEHLRRHGVMCAAYRHACMHVCMYACMYACMHTYIHAYIRDIHTYILSNAHLGARGGASRTTYVCVRMCVRGCACARVHAHVCVCVCVRVRACVPIDSDSIRSVVLQAGCTCASGTHRHPNTHLQPSLLQRADP
jgi:hypothetical protein